MPHTTPRATVAWPAEVAATVAALRSLHASGPAGPVDVRGASRPLRDLVQDALDRHTGALRAAHAVLRAGQPTARVVGLAELTVEWRHSGRPLADLRHPLTATDRTRRSSNGPVRPSDDAAMWAVAAVVDQTLATDEARQHMARRDVAVAASTIDQATSEARRHVRALLSSQLEALHTYGDADLARTVAGLLDTGDGPLEVVELVERLHVDS